MNLHLIPSPAPAGRPLVAVTFPLRPEERAVLLQLLGPGAVVADSRVAEHPDLVLVTPCSVQTMTKLREQYRDATIVVTDTSLSPAASRTGPVARLLEAGADEYTTGPWVVPQALEATA
ncbi:MAG: hypothetical protein JWN46_2424 [Acidimicrobiales bacterium]|nr:hypothetical protein [Acidimicrobiales bacterium]